MCMKKGDAAECSCNEGYELNKDGKTCDKIHPCDTEENGGCEEYCRKVGKDGSGVQCECPENYKLNADGVSCDLSK